MGVISHFGTLIFLILLTAIVYNLLHLYYLDLNFRVLYKTKKRLLHKFLTNIFQFEDHFKIILSIFFSVCAFTGDYFCDTCMSNEFLSIPARIVHNWDFKPYQISKKALDYIIEVKDHPIIDFKVSNIYYLFWSSH